MSAPLIKLTLVKKKKNLIIEIYQREKGLAKTLLQSIIKWKIGKAY